MQHCQNRSTLLACDRLHDLSKALVAIVKTVKDVQDIAVDCCFRSNGFEPFWSYSVRLGHKMGLGVAWLEAAIITVWIL